MIAFITGMVLSAILLGVAFATGLHKDKGAWTVSLIAIAAFYVVFAFQIEQPATILLQTVIALLFTAIALLGYMRSAWFIVSGLALHSVFDGVSMYTSQNPAPDWWGPFCIAVDVVMTITLGIWLKTRPVSPR